jgi:adenylate cyclase
VWPYRRLGSAVLQSVFLRARASGPTDHQHAHHEHPERDDRRPDDGQHEGSDGGFARERLDEPSGNGAHAGDGRDPPQPTRVNAVERDRESKQDEGNSREGQVEHSGECEVQRFVGADQPQRERLRRLRGLRPLVGQLLRSHTVEDHRGETESCADCGRIDAQASEGPGHSPLDGVADRDQAKEHEDHAKDDHNVDQGPGVAPGDDLSHAHGVIARCDRMKKVADRCTQRADNRANRTDPGEPRPLIEGHRVLVRDPLLTYCHNVGVPNGQNDKCMADVPESDGLSAAELVERAEATEGELERMVALGVLVPRRGSRPFVPSDVQKVRLAKACERAGLPMEGIGKAIEQGRVSFAFLEAPAYRRWAQRSGRTYREACREAGVPFEMLRTVLEAYGYARMEPDDRIREDELEIVPLVRQAVATGMLDEAWMTRVARAHAQGLQKAVMAETEVYHARFEMPSLQAGLGEREAIERAAWMADEWIPLVDRALMAAYRRQEELMWTEHQVEHIETALEEAGVLTGPERVPAMVFLDLVGYTRLTEERGDQVAAELAAALSEVVERSSRRHGGAPVKWLGDGVMFYFRDSGGAVGSAVEMVEEVPGAGLPPAHVGVAAGPVVAHGGDYFGRTVNLASRIAGRAGAGQVLVSERVVQAAAPNEVRFTELGELDLQGMPRPVRVFEARRG